MIDKIISDLTNSSVSLSSSLLQIKVFAAKTNNRELIKWVELEINGYKSEKIPDYRKVRTQIVGTYIENAGYERRKHSNAPIPLLTLNEKDRNAFEVSEIRDSISALETMVQSGDLIASEFRPEVCKRLSNVIGVEVLSAERRISKIQISELISNIRNKFLSFILELKDTLPEEEKEEEEKSKEEILEEMEDWFRSNYEDPRKVEGLRWDPEDEKYDFIYGGPYDADEVLQSKFGEKYDLDLIEELVSKLEQECTEWSGIEEEEEEEEEEEDEDSKDETSKEEIRKQLKDAIESKTGYSEVGIDDSLINEIQKTLKASNKNDIPKKRDDGKEIKFNPVDSANIDGIEYKLQKEPPSKSTNDSGNLTNVPLVAGKSTDVKIKDNDKPAIKVETLASEVSDIIKNLNIQERNMIGIFGEWGRGKTFLMNQIWKNLEKDDYFVKIEFQAWKYQDTPALWGYLYEKFAEKYYGMGICLSKFPGYKNIRLNLKRESWHKIVWFFFALILLLFSIYNLWQVIRIFPSEIIIVTFIAIIAPVISMLFKNEEKWQDVIKSLSQFSKKKNYLPLLGLKEEISKEIRYLVELYPLRKKKIILFVDDIDRCSEEKIIQIVDSLRVMLDDEKIAKRVVVVAAIDERVLKRSIKSKYHDSLEKDHMISEKIEEKCKAARNIINEYIDKLFIFSLKLNSLNNLEREEIIKTYFSDEIVREINKDENSGNSSGIGKTDGGGDESGNASGAGKADGSGDGSGSGSGAGKADGTGDGSGGDSGADSNNNVREKNNDSYEISSSEAKELIKLINNYKEATPRQIRIFYFRYLFARNLIYKKLLKGNVNTDSNNNVSLMGILLLYYTLTNDREQIKKDKEKLIKYSGEINIKTILEFEKEGVPESEIPNYVVDTKILDSVYSILETVIAY